MVSRSAPNAVVAYFVLTGFSLREHVASMPRVNSPEHTRAKAKRSRWLGSMLACTLKTKAENGVASARSLPSMSTRGFGAGAISMTASSNMRTPKLVIAEPTNTGVDSPARNDSTSTSASIASSSEQLSIAVVHAFPSSSAARSTETISSGASDEPRAVRVKRMYSPVRRSMTPRKSPGIPTGHVAGVGRSPICFSTSSRSSKGSRPGRSNLLKKVMTGKLRERHTWKSFSVCGSMPFAVSSTMMTASTAASTR